jgi:hypothetical protein
MVESAKNDHLYGNHIVEAIVLDKGKGCLVSDATAGSP